MYQVGWLERKHRNIYSSRKKKKIQPNYSKILKRGNRKNYALHCRKVKKTCTK